MNYHILFDVMNSYVSAPMILTMAIVSAIIPVMVIGIGGSLLATFSGRMMNLRVIFAAIAAVWAVIFLLFTVNAWKGIEARKKALREGRYATVEGVLSVTKKGKYTEYRVKTADEPAGRPVYLDGAVDAGSLREGDSVRIALRGSHPLRVEVGRPVDYRQGSGDWIVAVIFMALGIPFGLIPVMSLVRFSSAMRAVQEALPAEAGLLELRRESTGGWFLNAGSPGAPYRVSRPFVRLSIYADILVIRFRFNKKKFEDIVLSRAEVTGITRTNGKEMLGGVKGAVNAAAAAVVRARAISISHTRAESSNPVLLWPADPAATFAALESWHAGKAIAPGPRTDQPRKK